MWDPLAMGAAADAVRQLASYLPDSHFFINAEANGEFLSYHPDPTIEENLRQLIEEVSSEQRLASQQQYLLFESL